MSESDSSVSFESFTSNSVSSDEENASSSSSHTDDSKDSLPSSSVSDESGNEHNSASSDSSEDTSVDSVTLAQRSRGKKRRSRSKKNATTPHDSDGADGKTEGDDLSDEQVLAEAVNAIYEKIEEGDEELADFKKEVDHQFRKLKERVSRIEGSAPRTDKGSDSRVGKTGRRIGGSRASKPSSRRNRQKTELKQSKHREATVRTVIVS